MAGDLCLQLRISGAQVKLQLLLMAGTAAASESSVS